jgi:hypothetical protein
LFAQVIVLNGRITDKKNGSKLQGVTIKVGSDGTISDKEGNFTLTAKLSQLTEKGIKFTCIGYQSTRLIYQPNHFYQVALTPSNAELKEVIIGAGEDIIKKAIKRIPQNYPEKPTMLTGLLRAQIWRNKSHYFRSDAIIQAYVPPYNKNEKTIVTVLQNHIDSIYDKTLRYIRFAGAYDLVDFQDIVHNKVILNRIAKKRKFDYILTAKQFYNGHKVFVLNTTLKDTAKFFDKLEATFYIDTASYAFVAANVTFYNWIRLGVLKIQKVNYIVEYEQINNKWYLSQTHCNGIFEFRNEWPHFNADFIRTQIDTINAHPFLYKDVVQVMDDVYLVDKPANKVQQAVIDSLFSKTEREGKIEPLPTSLIDTIKKNNTITNPPNQNPKVSIVYKIILYISKGENVKILFGINKFPVSINSSSYNISSSVDYGYDEFINFRLYKGFFLEFGTYDNFWNNKHVDVNDTEINLIYNIVFNKKARSLTLTPFAGFDQIAISYKNAEYDYNTFNGGLRTSFELTHQFNLFISSGYNFANGIHTLNGLNITPTHYSIGFGLIFKL